MIRFFLQIAHASVQLFILVQVLYVKEFGLFSTTFRRVDGQEIIAPNALLASSKLVHNLRRSKSMYAII